MAKLVVVVLGPTAVGKTRLALDLAVMLKGEILSADSMQIYKGMNIGTAKITLPEMRGIPHHILDFLSPNESFSACQYQEIAREHIDLLQNNNITPIMVGGTGLYIDSALFNYDYSQPVAYAANKDSRHRYQTLLAENGPDFLHQMLRSIDPASGYKIHVNDHKRVIRALEFFDVHGYPISENSALRESPQLLYPCLFIGLTLPRPILYERINQRVDQMFQQGLVEEVEKLLQLGIDPNCQSMQGIGYKEVAMHLLEKTSLDDCVEAIKQNTRRYAKRQLTWFRRNPYIHWYDPRNLETIEKVQKMWEQLLPLRK